MARENDGFYPPHILALMAGTVACVWLVESGHRDYLIPEVIGLALLTVYMVSTNCCPQRGYNTAGPLRAAAAQSGAAGAAQPAAGAAPAEGSARPA